MKRRIVYSALARQDLRGLRQWTHNTFGQAQADRYVRQIGAALKALAQNPSLGRDAGEIRPGLRKFLSGSHILFFSHDDAEIRVIRLLHGKMDPERWV